MYDTFYFSIIVVRARSGQEEYTETIHLSEFKTVTVWLEGLYAYCLDLKTINVDIWPIHDTFYISVIIARVRSGQ